MQRALTRLGGVGVGVGPGGGQVGGAWGQAGAAQRLLRALVEEGRMPLLTPLGRNPLTVQFAHGSLQALPISPCISLYLPYISLYLPISPSSRTAPCRSSLTP